MLGGWAVLGQVWGEGRGVGGGPGHRPELGGSWGLPLPQCRAQLQACGGAAPHTQGEQGRVPLHWPPRLQHSRAPTPHCAHRRVGTPGPPRPWPYGPALSLGRVAELCSWAGARSLTLRGAEGERLAAALGVRGEDWGVRTHRCWCPPAAARRGWWELSARGPPGWFPAAASACVSPPPWR